MFTEVVSGRAKPRAKLFRVQAQCTIHSVLRQGKEQGLLQEAFLGFVSPR